MDSNSLLAKLLSVLLHHLLASLLSDIGLSFGLGLLLLHSQETHFALVKSLFRVLKSADVSFEGSQISQVLDTALI